MITMRSVFRLDHRRLIRFRRLHDGRHQFKEPIDLFLIVVNTEADSDHTCGIGVGAVGKGSGNFIGDSHQAPYIRMRAERAAPCRYAAELRELLRDQVGIDIAEIKGDDAYLVADILGIALNIDVGKRFQPVDELAVENLFVSLDFIHADR